MFSYSKICINIREKQKIRQSRLSAIFQKTYNCWFLIFEEIPVLVMHGEEEQIVPFETTGKVAATLLKNGKLISYPGFPNDMPATEAETINRDLLAFFKS